MSHSHYWNGDASGHADAVRRVSEGFHHALGSRQGGTQDGPSEKAAAADRQRPSLDIDAGDFPDRLFERYLDKLKPREGGTWDDPNPTAGLTYKGITQKTVDRLRALPNRRWADLPKLPTDLSDQQISEIYREQYFDLSRAPIIAAMPGVLERTPELPEQLFDSSVQHSPAVAGRFLQQALEETVGVKELRDSKTGDYTGNVGPKTQAALRQAIAEGKLDEVNDRMAEIRLRAVKNGNNYKKYADQREGLENRVLSFKTSKRKKPAPAR